MVQQSHIRIYSQRKESGDSNRYLHPRVHSSVLHNCHKVEPTQLSLMDKWTDKTRCPHTRDYHSASKRTEILTPATTWMNHEDTTLSEPASYRHILYDPTNTRSLGSQTHGDRKQSGGCRGPGRGWAQCSGGQFQFGKMKKCWRWQW